MKDEAKRGRPKHLTRETIVEAAAQFRQSDLNLSNLAEALEVTPQSLYHYFFGSDATSVLYFHFLMNK